MANDPFQQQDIWPMPAFYFKVTLDNLDDVFSFQEISGLDAETDAIEYRHGNSKDFSSFKMPGTRKVSSISMKKGMLLNGRNLREWQRDIEMNTPKPTNATIQLLDESGAPMMTWTLSNAWASKITFTDSPEADDAGIEVMVLEHEGLTVKNG